MRTIKIFGKNLPIAILAILMCGAVATSVAAVYFSIRGRADVTYRTPVIAEPSSYWVEMDQGEVTYQSITIINRSDLMQTVELGTIITAIAPMDETLTPEDMMTEELTITYSRNWIPLEKNMLDLMPNEEVPIEVTIAASWSIVPGSYAVETDIIPAGVWTEATYVDPATTSVGDVWPVPLTGTTSFYSYSDEIHVNTDDQKLGAFTLKIAYDPSVIMPTEVIDKPADWTIVANFDNAADGWIIVGGFTADAPLIGDDVHLLSICWEKVGTGTTVLDLTVTELTDYDTGGVVGTPNDIDGERTLE